MPRDPRVDTYIADTADFAQPILSWLRDRVHAACPGVEETIRWGVPSFTYAGRPLANMAAFKRHATFGVWFREEQSTGQEGEAMGQYGRIGSVDDLPDAAMIEEHVRRTMALIDAGTTPTRTAKPPKPEADIPDALALALADDAAATATFAAFPLSARRDYCEWIADAKRPETRDKRVGEAMVWLREGKRRNWKYEKC